LKRIISVFLLFGLIIHSFTLLSCSKKKVVEVDGNGICYFLNEDCESYLIINYQGDNTEVVIPSMYNGKPVTHILDYAFVNIEHASDGETSQMIPTITSIDDSDFEFNYYSNITSISIPEGIEYIGNCAFLGCVNLNTITIPSSVTTIGATAFWNCSNLKSIKFMSPSGWQAGDVSIIEIELLNEENAAMYLISTHCNKIWNKN